MPINPFTDPAPEERSLSSSPLEAVVSDDPVAGFAATPATASVPPGGSLAVKGRADTPSSRLCSRLQEISGLTDAEIAPLLGISRRSWQSWLAGASVSARKEAHLRQIVEAVEKIAAKDATNVRDRLLHREAWSVRPYDLLVEGRFDTAVDLANGTGRRGVVKPRDPWFDPLDVQLSRDPSSLPRDEGRINPALSRSL